MVKGIIEQLFFRFIQVKEFTFRFDEYDGSEESLQVYEGQVSEYEFINSGTTICIIGDGLRLYPTIAGIEPTRVKLTIQYNERDTTVYPIKFMPCDIKRVTDDTARIGTLALVDIEQQLVVDTTNIVTQIDPKEIVNFNRLVVISKVVAKTPKRLNEFAKSKIDGKEKR